MDDGCPKMDFCPYCEACLVRPNHFAIDGPASEDIVVGTFAVLACDLACVVHTQSIWSRPTRADPATRINGTRVSLSQSDGCMDAPCHRLIYTEGNVEVWKHKTPTYEILTERDLKCVPVNDHYVYVCACVRSLTGLGLTGTLKIFGVADDGQRCSSATLPALTVRLECDGSVIQSVLLDELRQFQFLDLELGKTYTVRIGMDRALRNARFGSVHPPLQRIPPRTSRTRSS